MMSRPKQVAFIKLAVIFLMLNSLLAHKTKKTNSRPHILLMLADDLGWTDVGFHGSKIHTPNIDTLAKEGVILDNFYVQPVCTPTRATLMTGRYPIHIGFQHRIIKLASPYGLPLDFQTLPEQLRKAEYATHLVGKWHLGFYKWPYVPTNRGFDSAYGLWSGSEDHYNHTRGGIIDFHNGSEPVRNVQGKYATFEYVNRVKEIIDFHDPKQPLFIYMAFQNPHSPNQAPDEYVNKYDFIDDDTRRTHAGMMDILDEAVGNITKMFQEAGLWENTLTIFSTDNGGEPTSGGYNWPLRGKKHDLFEGGVRGTAFVHGKMLEKTGVKCKELLHICDFFPTLINLAGGSYDADKPTPVDGFDVWNTISRGDPSPRTEILLNIDNEGEHIQGMGLRVGHMKLLMNVDHGRWLKPPEIGGVPAHELLGVDPDMFGKRESRSVTQTQNRVEVALFNITADPEERQDLSFKLPDVVAKMKKKMQSYAKSSLPSLYKPPDNHNAIKEARKRGVWGPWM